MMPAPNPVLVNDPALTERISPSLAAVVGKEGLSTMGLQTLLHVAVDYLESPRPEPPSK
jgi:hypothetical protein